MPTNYLSASLNWTNWNVWDAVGYQAIVPTSGFSTGVVSRANVGWNNYAQVRRQIIMKSSLTFMFWPDTTTSVMPMADSSAVCQPNCARTCCCSLLASVGWQCNAVPEIVVQHRRLHRDLMHNPHAANFALQPAYISAVGGATLDLNFMYGTAGFSEASPLIFNVTGFAGESQVIDPLLLRRSKF